MLARCAIHISVQKRSKPLLRIVLFIVTASFVPCAHAAQVRVQNPCAENTWLNVTLSTVIGSSVGSVTLEALTNLGVPFQGSEHGIHSIRNTVTGDDALEVISDREMRAYGWCYRLNGVEPDLFPDQVFVQSDADVIDWFFGFAHYKDGNWVTYCTPTQNAGRVPPKSS